MKTFPLTNRGLTLTAIAMLILLAVLAAVLAGASFASAQGSAPDTPTQPTGTAVFTGGVDLEWNDVPGADSYDVQLFRNGQWIDLPGDGVEIAFYGAGAIISELDPSSTHWFQVRARNAHGSSDWSDYGQVGSTSQTTLGKRVRPDNVTASGAPVINGTAQVGESLTADAAGIEDGNGLDRVQFRFQWVTNDGSADADITGATDSSYTLVAADEGRTVKVRVSFTDRGGYAESLTSAATDSVGFVVQQQVSNSPASGAPAITGTAQVGETLTADISTIADADGLTNVSHSYQWVGNDGTSDTDITGATGSTYTLVDADEGSTIRVRVSFTDDAANEESLTSAATGAVAAAPPSHITVEVTEDISDPNNIVTNFTVTWSDADDCSTSYNAYLNIEPWTRPGHETPGSQLNLGSAASDGANIAKGLTGIQDSDGFNVELYCGTDGSGRMVSSVDIPKATAYGRPKPGTYSSEPPLSALSVSHGTMTPTFNGYTSDYNVPDVDNADTRITITATPKAGYFIKIFEASSDERAVTIASYGGGVAGIPSGLSADCNRKHSDNLGPLIELTDADPNTPGFQVDVYDGDNYITVRVYPTAYCDTGTGYPLAITRAEGTISFPRPNRPATGRPHIRPNDARSPYVGATMNADVSSINDRDAMTNATLSYQWLADDAEIAEVTSSSYTVPTTDLGKILKVRVSFTDDRGTEETLTSGASNVVKLRNRMPTGKPIIRGRAKVGRTLRADVSAISDPNGLTNATFAYEWINTHGDSRDSDEYTLLDGDAGNWGIWLRVTYTDDAGHEEQLDSEPIGVVEARPNPNSPATGAPTITGTLQVGQTLTADTSGIADADGLSGAIFSYQWGARDQGTPTDIAGATDSTYTLVAADEGNNIKVRVSFTDDAANAEKRISAETDTVSFAVQQQIANSPATGAPSISGTAQVGETLTADTSGIADADGLTNVTYSYEWIINDGSSETVYATSTGPIYILAGYHEGKTIKVRVSFTDDAANAESLTSAATATVEAASNNSATGAPSITGIPLVGETLTADTSGIADADALTNFTFSYQWVRNDGSSDTDIMGATGSTYTLVEADEDRAIKVRVSLTSTATDPVGFAVQQQIANSPATGAPSITGTAQVGETLTADTSGIADSDGLTNVSYSYQWIRNDRSSDTDIQDATDSTYTLAADDEGMTIKVTVSFTDDAGYGETLTSAATAAVDAASNNPATGAPAVSGTAQVGETLTADTSGIADADGLANVAYRYQWVANDGSSDTDITGATDSTYTLVNADVGKTIRVRVSFTDDAGNDETLTSTATEAVAEPDEPPAQPQGLTGTVAHDAVSLTWNDPGDATITGYQILRRDRALHGQGDFQVHVDDTGSAVAAYTDRDVSPERTYVYRIKARNAAGLSERSTIFRGNTPTEPE